MRFLNRDVVDIMRKKQLRENDILCLTETQILPNECGCPIKIASQSQFWCQFNSNEKKFCRIDLYSQVSINIVSQQMLDGIPKVVFQK